MTIEVGYTMDQMRAIRKDTGDRDTLASILEYLVKEKVG